MIIRHGSLLAIAEICFAFSQNDFPLQNNKTIFTTIQTCFENYPQDYLESFGSELTRTAICRFTECFCLTKWPLPSDIQTQWQQLLESSLRRKEEPLQQLAASALGGFCKRFGLDESKLLEVIQLASDTVHGPYSRRGFALLMGNLPHSILQSHTIRILNSLKEAMKVHVSFCFFFEKKRKNLFS